MAHKNYGGISHTNTGYNNHTNNNSSQGYGQNHSQYHQAYNDHTNYGNHTNTGYSRGYNNGYNQNYSDYHQSYHNHTNKYDQGKYYNNHYNYSQCRDRQVYKGKNRVSKKGILKHSQSIGTHSQYTNYNKNYRESSGTGNFTYGQYRNVHTNTSYANNHYQAVTDYHQSGNHANTGGYSKSGYANGYTQAYTQYNQSSGYTNHSNSGYTNHVNTTTNHAPGNVSNVSKGSAVYYKDSINLTWTAATDNNKCIWGAAAWWQDYASCPDRGIWENTTLVQSEGRSWSAYRWNSSGTRVSASGVFDTYGDAGRVQPFINYLNTYNTGDYFVIIGSHEPNQNAAPIHNLLKSWGFSFPHLNDIASWVGICKMGTGILAEQSARRYGKDYATVSASYTIPGVSSGQTISYYIDYCFKPIGGTYGSWTRIGTTTATSYNYNLSTHGNGHIKFRVLSTDGVENGSSWIESPEVRVLKYTAPSSWGTQEKVTASDFESLRLEINKLAGAVGTATSGATATAGNLVPKTTITDFRDKVKLIAPQISKTAPTDSNLDIIRAADINNLKNWLKGV